MERIQIGDSTLKNKNRSTESISINFPHNRQVTHCSKTRESSILVPWLVNSVGAEETCMERIQIGDSTLKNKNRSTESISTLDCKKESKPSQILNQTQIDHK